MPAGSSVWIQEWSSWSSSYSAAQGRKSTTHLWAYIWAQYQKQHISAQLHGINFMSNWQPRDNSLDEGPSQTSPALPTTVHVFALPSLYLQIIHLTHFCWEDERANCECSSWSDYSVCYWRRSKPHHAACITLGEDGLRMGCIHFTKVPL